MFPVQSLLVGNGTSVTCLRKSREPITALNEATYVTPLMVRNFWLCVFSDVSAVTVVLSLRKETWRNVELVDELFFKECSLLLQCNLSTNMLFLCRKNHIPPFLFRLREDDDDIRDIRKHDFRRYFTLLPNAAWNELRMRLLPNLFLESPENFSGPKSQLSNCNHTYIHIY